MKTLSATEEKELFNRYIETKDKKIRDEIVLNYLYIAEILAKRFVCHGIDYDDLYQVASMTIILCCDKFNPERGVRFATYLTPSILGAIRNYFRDTGNIIKIPPLLYEKFYKYKMMCKNSANEKKSDEEIAKLLNIEIKDIEKIKKMGDMTFLKSLEMEAFCDGNLTLMDTISKDDNSFVMIEDKDFITKTYKTLSKKEQDFIKFRYYENKSQSEIAKIWGVSQMYVSRFEKTILKKLYELYYT